AIVRDPKVFLMDEPLSNLDAKLRVQTRAELAALQRRLGTTTVYVTHDQVEAMTMGDRVAVLKDGILQQVAPPRELYAEPVNEFVAGFIGSPSMNLFPGEGVTLGVRPEAMRVLRDAEELPAGWPLKEGTVDLVEELGSESYVYATAKGVRLVARLGDREVPERGERLLLSFDPGAAHRFDPQTGDRL
ncbi:MAG: TOBE domain-containing protein, partial [Corynebacterium marinum]|nr:TOBE domain-containing protein [Corynebacterium marinum]